MEDDQKRYYDDSFLQHRIKHPLVAIMSKDENNTFLKQGTFAGKLAF